MSEDMNCSGVRPGRFSHAGSDPAEGAMRSGGDSRVEWSARVLAIGRDGTKAVLLDRVDNRASVANFMVILYLLVLQIGASRRNGDDHFNLYHSTWLCYLSSRRYPLISLRINF